MSFARVEDWPFSGTLPTTSLTFSFEDNCAVSFAGLNSLLLPFVGLIQSGMRCVRWGDGEDDGRSFRGLGFRLPTDEKFATGVTCLFLYLCVGEVISIRIRLASLSDDEDDTDGGLRKLDSSVVGDADFSFLPARGFFPVSNGGALLLPDGGLASLFAAVSSLV